VLIGFVLDRFLNLEKNSFLNMVKPAWMFIFQVANWACLDALSQGSWRLVARGIHPIFGNSPELIFPEKAPTFLAILPSSVMFLIIMEMANAVVFMLELATTAPSIG